MMLDVSVPEDRNIVTTENWQVERHQDLTLELRTIYGDHPEVTEAPLGTFTKRSIWVSQKSLEAP